MKAKELWESIKDKQIDVFAVPGQKVNNYFEFVDLGIDTQMYLTCKAMAALPALEVVIGPEYMCYQAERFIIVEKKQ